MRRHLSAGALSLLMVALTACSAAPVIDEYPRAEIERPMALPVGLAQWETIALWNLAESDLYDEFAFGIWPFAFRVAPWKNVNLLLLPVPLGVDWQLEHVPGEQTTGLSARWSLGYGSVNGFFFAPTIMAYHRRQLSKRWALVGRLGAGGSLGGSFPGGLRAGAAVEPWFQASEHLALGLRGGLVGGPGWAAPFPGVETYHGTAAPSFHAAVLTVASLGRQWDLAAEAYLSTGYQWPEDIEGEVSENVVSVLLRATYTW
ncbi:MAG: hypothetical protein IT285_02070 [Bdellovibrionales bacterium]|nr:hypothetical protein [Bdellovibrionales bacterium]